MANAALFLASDEASFITGSVLAVDGGITAANKMFAVARQGKHPITTLSEIAEPIEIDEVHAGDGAHG